MKRCSPAWRGTAAMPVAALAVHQLRYELAFGSHAGRQLAIEGHGYLEWVTPVVIVIASLALGGILGRVVAAWRTGQPDLPVSRRFVMVWLATALGLLAVYTGQELLEGLVATGHPAGIAGVFGAGGLWAIPAALAIGALLAVFLAVARRAVVFAARARRGRRSRARPTTAQRRAALPLRRRSSPLATAGAGRAPPPRSHPMLV